MLDLMILKRSTEKQGMVDVNFNKYDLLNAIHTVTRAICHFCAFSLHLYSDLYAKRILCVKGIAENVPRGLLLESALL